MSNVVDSCGWIEFIANGDNADFFAPVLLDESNLIIPQIVIYEVARKFTVHGQIEMMDNVFAAMKRCKIAGLLPENLVLAAQNAAKYKLHMADAIIWQTAQAQGATLYTQDAGLKGLPNVKFKAKRN